MASCVRNICTKNTRTKNYQNLLISFQVTAENVEDAFFERQYIIIISLCCCCQVDGVTEVHELHVWQLAGNRIIATAHVRCRRLNDYVRIAEQVKSIFHNGGIHSTTVQPEFAEVRYYIHHRCLIIFIW